MVRIEFSPRNLGKHGSEQEIVVLVHKCDLSIAFRGQEVRQFLRDVQAGEAGSDDYNFLIRRDGAVVSP